MIRYCLLLFIAVAAFVFNGCSEEKKETAAPVVQEVPPLPVEVVTVAKENVPLWAEYTGKTEASKRVDISARVSGRLEQILFKEGDYVEKGETLFVIERDTYEAALAEAKARLAKDKASLVLAQKDVERYRPLVAEDLAPRVTLEQNEARVAELEAVIKGDQAKITETETKLSYTVVSAPISGKISRTLVDVGNIVGYGGQTVLTTMVADDLMYAYFNPSESQFQLMRQYKSQDQMMARVRISNKSEGLVDRKPLTGKVDFTDNRVDSMTGTITMRAEVANPDHTVLEGTFVYVELMITDQVSFLMIPPGAVQEDQLGSFVYVVAEDNTAKRVEISIGFENRHYLLVTKGLEGGEQVVISGLAKVRPKTKLSAADVTEKKGVIAVLAEQGLIPGKE